MASTANTGTGYLQLFRDHKREVAFSTLLNFGSGFGQTYFISLILPAMALTAGVSMETAGSFYAVATVLSAALLALTGHWADQMHPRLYATGCTIVLGLAALFASGVQSWVSLFIALVLIRWSGQGLLPHASNVAIAKSFPRRPGAAYALASLGIPIGEACFPAIIVGALSVASVSMVWLGFSAWILAGCLPLLWWTGASCRIFETGGQSAPGNENGHAPHNHRVWSDRRIWWLVPHIFAIPFVMTGILFYQSLVSEETGWSPWLWASGMSLYALARALFSLLTGGWFSQRDALPWLAWSKLPLTAGIGLVFLFGDLAWTLPVFFVLAGTTMGADMVVGKTSLVELYGPEIIGRAKAATNAVLVLSTAAAPPAMAALAKLLDGSWTHAVLGASVAIMAVSIVWTLLAVRVLTKK